MTLDRFLRLAQIVSNTIWARYYLASWPSQMVLEVVNLDGSMLDGLRADLLAQGFQEMPSERIQGIERLRFAVARDDGAPAGPLFHAAGPDART